MAYPEGTDTARIIEPTKTFPLLAKQKAVTDWDPSTFDQWAAGGASSGQRLAVRCHQGVAKVGQCEHWAAFLQWV